MSDTDKLRKVVEDLHGVKATFLRNEPVFETFRGQSVWEGIVAVFSITGHDAATHAYAWAHGTDEGGRRYVAILGVPPIESAGDAVKAAVMAEIRTRSS